MVFQLTLGYCCLVFLFFVFAFFYSGSDNYREFRCIGLPAYQPIPSTFLYDDLHCMKSFQVRSFFWSVFSCIRTEYGDLLSKSPYSVRMQENTDQKKLHIWTLFTQCYKNTKQTKKFTVTKYFMLEVPGIIISFLVIHRSSTSKQDTTELCDRKQLFQN